MSTWEYMVVFSKYFLLIFQPTNDESPVILGDQVVLEKGQTVVVKNGSLFISDSDTEPEDLQVKIEQPPSHGESWGLCLILLSFTCSMG